MKDVTVNGVTAWSGDATGGVGGFALIFDQKSRIDKGTVNLGGFLAVAEGATAGIVTVNNGGKLIVTTEGKVEDVTVNGVTAWNSEGKGGIGGFANIFGEKSRIDKGTVNLGGALGVAEGATAGTVTVNNGGKLIVTTEGKVEDVTVNGVTAWNSEGKGGIGGFALIFDQKSRIDKGTVNLGGALGVAEGATAGTVTVNNGGKLLVTTEGKVEDVTVNGGIAYVSDQGEITGESTVDNGGRFAVLAGGKAGNIILNGGPSAANDSYALVEGVAGDITINRKGHLFGWGTVGNLLAHAGGEVWTGNNDVNSKLATLTATGDATFDKGSIFNVQIANDGSSNSKLAIKGQANLLGGVVNVRSEGVDETTGFARILSEEQVKNFFQKRFDILTAEKGIKGKFDDVVPHYNYITPLLAYTDKTVSLGFDLTETAKTEAADKLAAEQAAALAEAEHLKIVALEERVKNLVLVDAVTLNQKSTGHAVLQLGLGNPLLQTVLFSKKGEVLHYDTLSGEAHASLRGTLLQDAGLVSGAASERVRAAFDGVAVKAAPVATPLAYGPDARGKNRHSADQAFDATTPAPVASTVALWGQAYGGWSHGSSDGNAAAYNRNTGGIVTGMDGVIADTWRLGVLAGYGSTSLHGAGSSTSVDSYQLGVYGGTKIDALRLSLGTVLAHHEIDSRRKVSFGSLQETDTAGYSANTVQLFGEAAYRIDTPYAALEPFAAAAYTHLKTDGFTETGGIAALSAPSSSTDLTTTTLGLRASRAFTIGNAASLTARGMAGWRHAYGDVTPQAQFAFASGGESFDVNGLPVAADAALVEAGLAFDIGKATTIGLTYTGQFSSQVNDNSVKADLTVRF
ncbi:outer membrane autotransporter protein [Phyllobacterium myrsinacearum]|uniref:Outer membrane autotransporter protein n=1 Tax=Phyllobacterium myrsinacearum TaxID=28101 RepID=A0A839EA01_9HYPH|nr:outer membrane autotransporter protein [Phyllobacterium myrsinacearum]